MRMTLISLLLLLIAVASPLLSVAAADDRVNSWETLFDRLNSQDLLGVMQLTPGDANLPVKGAQFSSVKTGSKKLSNDAAKKRHQELAAYFAQKFPDVSFANFVHWAQGAYHGYLEKHGLEAIDHLKVQAEHRSLIFGLYAAYVYSLSIQGMQAALNDFAILDPSEAAHYTGLDLDDYDQDDEANDDQDADGRNLRRKKTKPPKKKTKAPTLSTGGKKDSKNDGISVFGGNGGALPNSFDLRSLGGNVVPSIRNQEQCGSCWAFVTVFLLESMAGREGFTYDLSEQQLVSCDNLDGGCRGGNPGNAFSWINSNPTGLTSEAIYPYGYYPTRNPQTPSCQSSALPSGVVTTDGRVYYARDDAGIRDAVYSTSPVIIFVAGGDPCFQTYSGGTLSCKCTTAADHVIAIIGWTDTTWTVRNSWGTSWGDSGYISMLRGQPDSSGCIFYDYWPLYISAISLTGGSSPPTFHPTNPGALPTPRPTPQPHTTCPTSAPLQCSGITNNYCCSSFQGSTSVCCNSLNSCVCSGTGNCPYKNQW